MQIERALSTGYRFTHYQEYPALSQETDAYSATLTRAGSPVANVSNEGQGGISLARFDEPEEAQEFAAAATGFAPDLERTSAEEAVLEDLRMHAIIVQELTTKGRKQLLVQLPEDGSVWETGSYRAVKLHGLPRDERAALLRKNYPDLKVWHEEAQEFRTI